MYYYYFDESRRKVPNPFRDQPKNPKICLYIATILALWKTTREKLWVTWIRRQLGIRYEWTCPSLVVVTIWACNCYLSTPPFLFFFSPLFLLYFSWSLMDKLWPLHVGLQNFRLKFWNFLNACPFLSIGFWYAAHMLQTHFKSL